MDTQTNGQYRSITGKLVEEGKAPTHTMEFSRPVRIMPEQMALGFDKKEEEAAVCSLRNISKKEKRNRQKISNFGLLLSILGIAVFVTKDNEIPRFYRFAMSGPFGIWIGYLLSAKAGI